MTATFAQLIRSVGCAMTLTLLLSACTKPESSTALVVDAKQYLAKGEDKAALIQLKNAAEKSPNDGEVRLLLGQLYNRMNDAVSAEKELRRALALGIPAERVQVELAEALMAQSQPAKVLAELKNVTSPTPAILALRGRALLDLGQRDAAREAFSQALTIAPTDVDSLLGMARYSMVEGKSAEAKAQVAKALAHAPTHIDALMFEAELLRAESKDSEALAVYDKVLTQKPEHATAHLMKAHLAISAGKYDTAKAELAAVRKVTPRSLALYHARARLEFTQGNYREALDAIQAVLSSAPKHMPSVLMAGAINYALGSNAQAEQHFRDYLEFEPDNLYARKMLASTQLKTGKLDDVKAVLAPALRTAPADAELYLIAGNGAMQRQDYGQASTFFTQANTLAPGAAEVHTALGVSALKQGKYDVALAELSKSVDIDPKAEKPTALLVSVHLRNKDYDKAMALVRQLEKEKPGSALAKNLEGAVYLGQRNVAAARASFEKSVTLDPSYWQPTLNLGQLDVNAKNPQAALQRYRTFIDRNKDNLAAQLAVANLEMAQGHRDQATQMLERARREHPDALQPAILLGGQYLHNAQIAEGLKLAQALQVSHPADPDVLDLLGQLHFAGRDYAAALESFSKLAAVRPNSAMAHYRVAQSHMALGNSTAARGEIKRALALRPGYQDALLAQATLDLGNGAYDAAAGVARQIQAQPDGRGLGLALEGDVMRARGKPAEAAVAYEKALELQGTPAMLIKTYVAWSVAGQAQKAEAQLASWLSAHPKQALEVRLYLGNSARAADLAKESLPHFQAALAIAPQNADALSGTAWALHETKTGNALGYAEQAYKIAPDNGIVLDTLGWILTGRGETARAVPLLQKAVDKLPQAMMVRYHLGVALAKTGDRDSARKVLDPLAKASNFTQAAAAQNLLRQL